MGYADRRTLRTFTLRVADMVGAPADDTNLFGMLIPAGREVYIYDFRAYVSTGSGASDKLELTKADATVLASIDISTSNTAPTPTQTLPIRVAPSASDTVFFIRSDGALGATTSCDIEVDMSDVGNL